MGQMIECPKCQKELTLCGSIILMPSESHYHEIDIQWLKCEQCGSHFYGEYIEYAHMSFDSEADYIHRLSNEVDLQEWGRTLELLKNCPDPYNRHCTCDIHKRFTRNR